MARAVGEGILAGSPVHEVVLGVYLQRSRRRGLGWDDVGHLDDLRGGIAGGYFAAAALDAAGSLDAEGSLVLYGKTVSEVTQEEGGFFLRERGVLLIAGRGSEVVDVQEVVGLLYRETARQGVGQGGGVGEGERPGELDAAVGNEGFRLPRLGDGAGGLQVGDACEHCQKRRPPAGPLGADGVDIDLGGVGYAKVGGLVLVRSDAKSCSPLDRVLPPDQKGVGNSGIALPAPSDVGAVPKTRIGTVRIIEPLPSAESRPGGRPREECRVVQKQAVRPRSAVLIEIADAEAGEEPLLAVGKDEPRAPGDQGSGGVVVNPGSIVAGCGRRRSIEVQHDRDFPRSFGRRGDRYVRPYLIEDGRRDVLH